MKISTWNVNGIRAMLGKGLKDWMQTQAPDVLCLQEIKARPEQLSDEQRAFSGYGMIWNPAQRPGYSGVATLYKEEPPAMDTGFGESRFDLEGRVVRTRHSDFWLYNIYFPNGQRGAERLSYKLDFYASLLTICNTLLASGENVIITGDFNTAHMPVDLHDPSANQKTSGFMPDERAFLDRYLEHGFVDVYRRLYPERVQYTWWNYRMMARQRNLGWRIDYFLVSTKLASRVRDVIIHDDVFGSDHCPVSLLLD
jgi:exodeoxyribonuclease-3